jgi:hypothetical protein
MPQVLNTLDEIARAEQRDVVCVMFFDPRQPFPKSLSAARHALRSAFIQFLDDHSIFWCECLDPGSENLLPYAYRGSLYLDVPYDLADPAYRLVVDYLETPDGEPRYEDVHFCFWTLNAAMDKTPS